MLHLTGGGYQIALKLDESKVTVGNTYTVRFDYNINKGKFRYNYRTHIDNGVSYKALEDIVTFNLFYDRDTSVGIYLRMFANVYMQGSGENGFSYTINHVDENTVEYTFKITNGITYKGDDGKYYVGFWVSQGDIDLYVANMVMYDTDDKEQTNILPKLIDENLLNMNLNDIGMGGKGYENPKTGLNNNTDLENYNKEKLTPVPKGKQMLHLTDGGYQVGLKLDKSKITLGNTYTVRFDYKLNDGAFRYDYKAHIDNGDLYTPLNDVVTFNLFYDRNTIHGIYLRMFANVYYEDTGDNGYSYIVNQVDANTMEYTFKITEDITYEGEDGCYYVGFWLSKGDIDLYVSDMVMYDNSDAEQKNILPMLSEFNLYYMELDDLGMAGHGYDQPTTGINESTELLDYDETKFN